MVLNNKGQVIFFGLMIGITVIVLALALAPVLGEFTDGAMNETDVLGGQGLNCTSTTLSWADEGACLIVDFSLPYFILSLMAIGLIYLGGKFVIENV